MNKMNGKLIKQETHYHLAFDKEIVGSTHKIIAGKYKLSLKNCEAIERGYDFDELAESRYPIQNTGAMFMPNRHEVTNIYRQEGFIEGAKAILEILGDKKFSEDDMHDAVMLGYCFDEPGIQGISTFNEAKELAIKRAIKTEWDVEIVTEPMNLDEIREQGKGFLNTSTRKPKLNADGCLILKKVKWKNKMTNNF